MLVGKDKKKYFRFMTQILISAIMNLKNIFIFQSIFKKKYFEFNYFYPFNLMLNKGLHMHLAVLKSSIGCFHSGLIHTKVYFFGWFSLFDKSNPWLNSAVEQISKSTSKRGPSSRVRPNVKAN